MELRRRLSSPGSADLADGLIFRLMSGPRGVAIIRPTGIGALAAGYGALFDKAAARFAADDRVRAMWVHGAMARHAADAGSDLDISLAVRDADFSSFAAEWESWLGAITPTVTARKISDGSFYALTTDCLRFDVISEPVGKLPESVLTRRIVVFDKDGLNSLIPPSADPPPNARDIAYVIEETLRQAANFPTVIVRQDWLLGVIAVQQVQLFLYELFAESNKPTAPTGPKQWSHKLTPRQRQLLEDLPVAAPTRQSVMTARQAAFRLFFAEVPRIAAATGVTWPGELEAAVRAYLAREGMPLPNSDARGPMCETSRDHTA